MTQGFIKDKKFHPITTSKGVRKSRDQKEKTKGVKIRKQRIIVRLQRNVEREPFLETQLTDILTDVTIDETPEGDLDIRKLEKVVTENIIEILKREKIWKTGFDVDIQIVTARTDTSDEGGFYQYDYQIKESGKSIPLAGTVFGSISAGDVIDMELELFKEVIF